VVNVGDDAEIADIFHVSFKSLQRY